MGYVIYNHQYVGIPQWRNEDGSWCVMDVDTGEYVDTWDVEEY